MACILLVPKGPLVLLVKSVFHARRVRDPSYLFFYPQPVNGVIGVFVSSFSSDVGKSGRLDNVISTDDAYGIVSIVINWSFV